MSCIVVWAVGEQTQSMLLLKALAAGARNAIHALALVLAVDTWDPVDALAAFGDLDDLDAKVCVHAHQHDHVVMRRDQAHVAGRADCVFKQRLQSVNGSRSFHRRVQDLALRASGLL